MVLNFDLAARYKGTCYLRFDDTNPQTEKQEFVEACKRDLQWLGFEATGEPLFASDYFDKLYDFAISLIKKGIAYVEDQSQLEIESGRGTPSTPGVPSPFRDRSVEENLRLFAGMKAGECREGQRVLRARIDMDSPNMHLRDPVLYRVKFKKHYRLENRWCIFPSYDFAHGQSDAIEGITHSLCTLEFEPHRPLYEWFIRNLEIFPSRQIEFASLNLSYTVLSKTRLGYLVSKGLVSGWDDPGMPTLSGMRRRGYSPESLKQFCRQIGISKRDSLTDFRLLEHILREEFNSGSNRYFAVPDPLELVIENWPEGKVETLRAPLNPQKAESGNRTLLFGARLLIDRGDFKYQDLGKDWFRLRPDGLVRLKYAYIIRCTSFETDSSGRVTRVLATYIPESRSGNDTSNLKVKGTLSWVDANQAMPLTIRNFDPLFSKEDMSTAGDSFEEHFNGDYMEVYPNALAEPDVLQESQGQVFQFERHGYYVFDKDTRLPDGLVCNRTVSLRENRKFRRPEKSG